MDPSDSESDQRNLQMAPVTEDNTRVNRHITLPTCVTSGLASVNSIFCVGLLSGGAGGLLLGATAVVVLQSLELLADNSLLMDQLEKHVRYNYYCVGNNNQMHGIQMSIFAEMFGVFSSTLSLAVGIYIGLASYSPGIKKSDEAMGKALAVAGPVCLIAVTVTGYILGVALESFLSITLTVNILQRFFISVVVVCTFTVLSHFWFNPHSYHFYFFHSVFYWTQSLFAMFLIGFMFNIRLILVVVLIPLIIAARELEKSRSLKLTTVTVPLMLNIYDVYNSSGQLIVSLQSPTTAIACSVVLEAIFPAVLISLLLTITAGMSLFVSWRRSEAREICVTAAGYGTAVLGAIKLALPVLGPGPTIGALTGVAGAIGVSLSAAEAATDQYGEGVDRSGFVGRLGVTVGAAAGAFISSCAHSGLSGVFMGLCAATIPAAAFLKLILCSTSWRLFGCLWMCMCMVIVLIIFTHTVWLFHVLYMFCLANIYVMFYLCFLF